MRGGERALGRQPSASHPHTVCKAVASALWKEGLRGRTGQAECRGTGPQCGVAQTQRGPARKGRRPKVMVAFRPPCPSQDTGCLTTPSREANARDTASLTASLRAQLESMATPGT